MLQPDLPVRWTLRPPQWRVYVLVAANRRRTYVGITKDLERRLQQHNGEQPGGARSTRAGRPWTVVATRGPYLTQAEASMVEYRVKRLRRAARLRLADHDDEI